MNQLSTEKRVAIVRSLVEGCSIRSTVRMTGASKNTIAKLLVELGTACGDYQDRNMRNLSCKRLQLDEIWSFVGCKQKNVPEEQKGTFGIGDVWTWTAIDADTKLIPSYLVASRDGDSAKEFVSDLAGRLSHRVQITTDGLKSYLQAIDDSFGEEIDFAQLVKLYGNDPRDGSVRYSPGQCIGCKKTDITGNPDSAHISTSFVERANLTMRMNMRRFTRLTNGFSKKVENHAAAVSLHFLHYNFARIHQTLRCTPAMRAGIDNHVWSIAEIVELLDNVE